MKINLFYLTPCRFGGWVSYTVHLVRSLNKMGHEVSLYRVSTRDEKCKRNFAEDISYQNLSIETAVKVAASGVSLVAALDKRDYSNGFRILANSNAIVIHDTAEINKEIGSFLKSTGKPAIAVREKIRDSLILQGVHSVYIQHPYVRYNLEIPTKDWNAIATSRMDWDKYTHIIFQANAKIQDPEKRIRVYGAENRLYTHNKLTPFFPDWRSQHFGRFPVGHAVYLAARSKHVVDLTEIKGDGGGTQYTFLEAFNARAVLLVNSRWFVGENDVIRHGVNCMGVRDFNDLVDFVCMEAYDGAQLIRNGEELLENHRPEVVTPKYVEILSS